MPDISRNSGYSASQISSMQQDAIARVREMQRRAREKLQASNPPAVPQPAPPSGPARAGNHSPRPQPPAEAPLQGFLDRLGLDGETALILLLLLLLLNDGADRTLILALAYILIA